MNVLASLKDKVVVVTGGTRGIGFASVEGFLQQGSKVALLGSRKETVDHAMEELQKQNPAYPVKGYYPDLQNERDIQEMLEDVKRTFGSVDILVNNAGVSDATSLYAYDDSHFMDIMQVNVDAVFRMTRLIAPMMKEKGKGSIVNVSSMVSLYAQTTGSAYPTSKYAVNGMTKALSRELGKDGIRVNAIAPGITETDMVRALDQKMIERMSASVPLRRLGSPKEVANTILFLASDMSAYVTGALLSVDGGYVG